MVRQLDASDARVQWLQQRAAAALGATEAEFGEALHDEGGCAAISAFCAAGGEAALLLYRQEVVEEAPADEGEEEQTAADDASQAEAQESPASESPTDGPADADAWRAPEGCEQADGGAPKGGDGAEGGEQADGGAPEGGGGADGEHGTDPEGASASDADDQADGAEDAATDTDGPVLEAGEQTEAAAADADTNAAGAGEDALAPGPTEVVGTPTAKPVTRPRPTITHYVLRATTCQLAPDASTAATLYFLRSNTLEELPSTPSKLDDEVEMGVLGEGPNLAMLEQMLTNVYLPMMSGGSAADAANVASGAPGAFVTEVHSELVGNMQKFASQVVHTLQQLNGDIHLTIPDVDVSSIEAAVEDYDLVSQLESAMSEWTSVLLSAIQREGEKVPLGNGPLAEIDFWRERNASLSSLYEQLNLPNVKAMLTVLDHGSTDSNLLEAFQAQYAELTKLYVEAKDNVKFLTTLERHFKNISNGSMQLVLDTLPPMMNALRMVWIISRHYSDDTRMGNLLERIANEISGKVAGEMDLRVIFKRPAAESVPHINFAKKVLEQWSEIYLQVREKIETSGRDNRWEFDRRRLFERTTYMANICSDLREVVVVSDEFARFLGPELKAVTGDAIGIDDVIAQVAQMLKPIENLPFDPWDKRYSSQWVDVMAKFKSDSERIGRATRAFIDTSFKKLRSAESALELLRSFQSIAPAEGGASRSNASTGLEMAEKISDILAQFSREIDATREIFEANESDPCCTRNAPPVAGAINWSRSLFGRVRQTMNRFGAFDGAMADGVGTEVHRKYIALAKQMLGFEKAKFQQWSENVDVTAAQHLKSSIIASAADGTIVTNFHPDLMRLIRETRYLDRMGFDIPEVALSVCLQESKYHAYLEGLQSMLASYRAVTSNLSDAERSLLSSRLSALRRVLDPGFSPLNWNSLGVLDFISTATKAINDFQALVNQVQKSSGLIEKVVDSIARAQIACEPPAPDNGDVLDLTELYESMERSRIETVEELVRKYRTIGPLLGKIEEAVAGTNTGRSPQLCDYYVHWERRIFDALNEMVFSGMAAFNAIMVDREAASASGATRPLFKLTLLLNAPEILVQPPLNEAAKLFGRLVRNIVECTRPFVRWMDGTCVEAPAQFPKGEDEEPVIFTFFWDVSANPVVIKTMLTLNHAVQRTIARVTRQVESWQHYEHLWKQEKAPILEKFAARLPSCAAFEDKLAKYSRMAEQVRATPRDRDLDFIRLACGPLIGSVRDEAIGWVRAIARSMDALDQETLSALDARIEALAASIAVEPTTLDQLKGVLNALAEINSASMEMEISYSDLEERFRTRRLYGMVFDEQEEERCMSLRGRWGELARNADEVDDSLEDTKEEFCKVTQRQVADFQALTEEVWGRFKTTGPGVAGIDLDRGLAMMDEFKAELATHNQTREQLVLAEKLFDLPITSYPGLAELGRELDRLWEVYTLYRDHVESVASSSKMLWAELDIGRVIARAEDDTARLRKLKHLTDLNAYVAVDARIREFQESLPLIQDLKNDALRPRHWDQLMEKTGKHFEMDPNTFTLGNLFDMQLHTMAAEIGEITGAAIKELTIEKEIEKMAGVWAEQHFDLFRYKKGAEDRGWILKSTEEITLLLEDMGLNLQSMMGSRFVKPFLEEVRGWEADLSLIGEVLDIWMQVQRRWMYLESIFICSDDIRQQLPEEAKRFDRIDKTWKKTMVETSKKTNVLASCKAEGRLQTLEGLLEDLEACQKSLSSYLSAKRCAFPRFYFISDDELLSILGTSDVTSVQEHMLKLYDNCAALRFGRGNKTVAGMTSSEGESYEMRAAVATEGAVESWMTEVEAAMRSSLYEISKEGVWNYAQMARTKWILDHISMVVLVGSQIWWTWSVEDVFRRVRSGDKMAMKQLSATLTGQLGELTDMVRGDLAKLQRKKLNSLITLDVHARDIIDTFVRDSVLDEREFAWESQLRFYWDRAQDDIVIRQCTGAFNFGYEYQGINGRLVITALTDRCYMTLTTALTYRLGGAPAGPAGTGKTETVKDLAKAMALLCVVFNCGEGLDYKAMGSIFSGLVQCGAWGCFDEFNRIDAEVLSVVSSQIRQIQEALKNNQKRFQFEGREISCDSRAGIFITMNPGYAGRTELPDNLKALFRPVTMVVPDLEQICAIMLFSEGFDTATLLAKKMCVLYKLAKEQLSKQHHYDFGLRALKSVLVMAGSLKRDSPDMSEALVLMRALRDMNLPKFVFDDVPLFLGLINDLFPGLDCPRVRYPQLNDVLERDLKDHGYKVMTEASAQVDKCIMLYETMLTRHTTMVVGETGGGKSVIINTLARAQTAMGSNTKLHVLNGKSIPVSELYGVLDPETRDWTDGLLSCTFRELNRPLLSDKDEKRYIVFDGDVDAVWVENMNSVMDDNKLLTLPNGERIRLQPYVKLLFEVSDLQYASPATVSRCGMVYVDPKNLGYEPYVWRWLQGRPEAEAEALRPLFERFLAPLVDFVVEGVDGETQGKPLRLTVPRTRLNLATQLCTMLEVLLTEDAPATEGAALEALFLFCATWSLGAAVVQNAVVKERDRFDEFLKRLAGLGTTDAPQVGAGQLPTKPLYDYCFDTAERKWRTWAAYTPEYTVPAGVRYAKILVPTQDTVRSTWLLDALMSQGRSVLFVGETGTSKTVSVQAYLDQLPAESNNTLNINFSSRTSSNDVQRVLEDSIEKRNKNTYGPPLGKKLHCYVDDLNMPRVDTYGTQQPIAFLKLAIDRGGFYDRGKDLNWKNLKDVQYVGAMGPPGGARNPVDPRFMSLFSVFEIAPPSRASLVRIYDTLLEYALAPFGDEMASVRANLTQHTLDLYAHLCEKLPPTPSCFTYLFNMRDVSRVYEGLTLATPEVMKGPASIIRLWRNEVRAVFQDRMIKDSDRDVVTAKVEEIVRGAFGADAEAVLADPIIFGDYKNMLEQEGQPRLYQDLVDYASVKPLVEEILERYNEKFKTMELVMFNDALEHLTRIHRILRMERGNALLVGVGGSGKQSLSYLASYMAGCEVFTITLSRGYNEAAFREDLKSLYTKLGMENKKVAFLMTDGHVAEEGFLELLNNMLTSGMVPALYAEDEKDGMINTVREEVVKAGLPDSKDACWQYFVQKCQANLHVLLCMSPVGDTLRTRCRNFPGMVNNTVIDNFGVWPTEALKAVATRFLDNVDLPDAHRESVIDHMVMTHQSVRQFCKDYLTQLRRHNYVTPKNYLDFVSNYATELAKNRQTFGDMSSRLDGGLQKLIQAGDEVAKMQVELADAVVVVDKATKECNELLEVISKNTEEVEGKQKIAGEREAQLEIDSVEIAKQKKEAEEALEEAIPALEAAAEALNNLKKEEITEIRSFAKPHVLVQKVCECVVIMRGIKEVSWKSAKAMMSDMGFLNSLIRYDKDGITDKQMRAVNSYLKDPKFTPDEVMNISTAGAGLLRWVVAMANYNKIAKQVNPKRQAVATAEKKQRQAQKDLTKIKAALSSLQEQLAELTQQFETKTVEQQQLKEKAELMERRLQAASKLITGLESERTRWTADLETLATKTSALVGDCLLTSSFLSYAGGFTYDFRHQMTYVMWQNDLTEKGVPLTVPFRLETLLTDDVEVSQWGAEGLPADELSVQNGILTTRASRFPLCIDPQMQAVTWIKRREGKNLEGRVRTFNDADFLKQLELAIQYGFAFLFENLDEYIDPIIDPVLEKNLTVGAGGRKMIKLGDSEVEWDDGFQLYMTSKLSAPHYSPEVSGKTMIINYGVTQSGLQEQLLNVTVGHERADLEEQREALVQEMSANKATLKALEDSLLANLSSATGNILDNSELISTLDDAKTQAVAIGAALEKAKVTAEEIDEVRQGYVPAAARGAVLYFVMASLSAINNMYEYSLAAFLQVFNLSLDTSRKDTDLDARLRNIVDAVTQDVYNYTCTGLFEKHKLMFSFQMTAKIIDQEGALNREYLDFFLKGNLSLEKSARKRPALWFPEQGWEDLVRAAEIDEKFAELADHVEKNADAWQAYYDLEAPESAPMPGGFRERLDDFEQMIVMRCLRMDRVTVTITNYVVEHMGEKYITPPVLDYKAIYQQSGPLTPVVFVLSPGADPAFDVFKLGESMGYKPGGKLKYMALGQGMGPKAQEFLETGAARGLWVMLQNCHLLPSWLKTLEKILEKITNPHKDFRLFLTTDPTDKFPLGVLQRSLKVVTEPPNGLKLNMRASYSKITEETLAECPHEGFRPLVYVLSFFHAVVQERRKYGKLGWNVPYDFNETDMRISMTLINTYLTKSHNNGDDSMPWDTLRYLIGEAMYGGRVSDGLDRRILNTYLDEYLGDFLFDSFQPFHFYMSKEVDYKIPPQGPVANYTDAISELPMAQTPEVFGLHANADISYYTNATRQIWRDLVALQPRVGGGGDGVSREDFIGGVARDILDKLPEPFDMPVLRKRIGVPGPTTVVLLQELDRWNKMVEKMSGSLKDLQKALVGEIGMSAELDALGSSIFDGQLPEMWRRLTSQTEKNLAGWMLYFERRHKQYVSWVAEGEPAVMWLAGLQIPETYIAALVQTACREKGWPLDKSTLYTKVTTVTDPAELKDKKLPFGSYVSGLYLEGAGWDLKTSRLRRQNPKELVTELPVLQIIPVEATRLKLQNTFRAPVYVTQSRRNAMGVGLVFEADLATRDHSSHWVLQGVALTLNIS